MQSIKCTSYVSTVFEPQAQKLAVKELCRLLYDKRLEGVNCIVGCGVSGSLLAAIVANKLGKLVTIVRKAERSHATYKIEGIPTKQRMKYVVIDDLICSGDTIKHIVQGINGEVNDAEFMGLLLYQSTVHAKEPKIVQRTNCLGETFESEEHPRLSGLHPSEETRLKVFGKPKFTAAFMVEWKSEEKKFQLYEGG